MLSGSTLTNSSVRKFVLVTLLNEESLSIQVEVKRALIEIRKYFLLLLEIRPKFERKKNRRSHTHTPRVDLYFIFAGKDANMRGRKPSCHIPTRPGNARYRSFRISF